MTATTASRLPEHVRARLPQDIVLHELYTGAAGEMYDDIAATDPYEVPEIVAAVRRTRGPVLELAAGSGRLTRTLVRLGRPLTALDSSPDMLRLLDRRLSALPARIRARCTAVEGDMAGLDTLPLTGPYGAVVLATTSVTLLDEPGRRRLFGSLGPLLAEQGRLILTLLAEAPGDAGEEIEVSGESGRAYLLGEYGVPDPDGGRSRVVTLRPAVTPDPGPVPVGVSTVAVLPADDVLAELADAGLTVHRTARIPAPGAHASLLVEAGA